MIYTLGFTLTACVLLYAKYIKRAPVYWGDIVFSSFLWPLFWIGFVFGIKGKNR